ncbi:MAG TPA: dodecin family protein [Actinomycetota bacterium]|nr:dodecin family protein [Actinomycetota bacterium]
MTVEKFVDLTATGPSIDDAVAAAVQRAGLTLRGITGFEVSRIEGSIENGSELVYRVHVRISFVIREQLHE